MLETMSSDPIVEAIFDLQFSSRSDTIASILLAKFMSGEFRKRFPKHTRLPVADVPLAIRREAPEFKHQPEFRLQGDRETLLIGDQTFAFAVQEPYIGGEKFVEKIMKLIKNLAKEKEEIDVKRIAFRYMNLIETFQDAGVDLDQIEFKGSVAEYDLSKYDTLIKFQMNDADLLHTVQIKNNTVLTNNITGKRKTGLLVDIVTAKTSGLEKFWSESAGMVGKLRTAERNVFEKIIKEESLERYKANG